MKRSIITVKQNETPVYDIFLEQDNKSLPDVFKGIWNPGRKICIITDTNVSKFHLEGVQDLLQTEVTHETVFSYSIPAGEAYKNLDSIQKIYAFLIEHHFDRKDLLVALGGGVVGDMTGFTAATYLRGIDFIQIPTTLLSMVDSSIGGKTGVDFQSYKNMVGAFNMPKAVYINLSFLSTLPQEQLICGFGEVVKYGLIQDTAFYNWLKCHAEGLMDKDTSLLQEAVYQCCLCKKKVVEVDPFDKGLRAILNFGHTVGHAVEKLKDFSLFHGQCVGIGMAAAIFISWKRGYLSESEKDDMIKTLTLLGLPVTVNGLGAEEILSVTKNDKKMEAGIIHFVLLSKPGKAVVVTDLSKEELLTGIRSLLS